MKIWIITTGSSDVQLNTKDNWTKLLRNVRSQVDRGFTPTEGTDNRFLAPARVMGTVYSQSQAKELLGDITFPLLDNFVGQIQNEEINEIILILTDQTAVFSREEKRSQHCAYWQDTCMLETILTTYLKNKCPQAKLKPLLLKPTSPAEGLDDWDYVLKLVQKEFASLNFPNDSTIYVSHQAGTPAISSAVQFSSLAKFGQQVKFLVSSDRNSQLTRVLDSSTYLKGIQLQEAKALLERYDYAGVRDILGLTKTEPNNSEEKRIKYLLDAGEQWNFAEFQKFKNILVKRKLLAVNNFPWYQSGYESLYLAWVRFQQGSTVDALFHSFRAAEGSISKWAEKRYSSHITQKSDRDYNAKYGSQLRLSICTELPGYLNALSPNMQKNFKEWGKLGLYGVQLYELLKQARPEWEYHPDIKIVWEVAKEQRNSLFHRIEGLQESDVFAAWDTKSPDDWKKRILGCLNFIAKPDLTQEFTSLEEASLMFQVHKELEKAIAQSIVS